MSWILENLQTVGLLTGFLSDGLSGYANSAQYQIDAANAEARAEADRFNAEVLQQQATAERTSTKGDIEDFRRQQESRLAASRAAHAGSGFTMEGSPALVNEAVRSEIEFSVSRMAAQGELRARRLEQQSAFDARSAVTESANAKYTRQAGTLSVLTSTIGSIDNGLKNLKPTLVDGKAAFA